MSYTPDEYREAGPSQDMEAELSCYQREKEYLEAQAVLPAHKRDDYLEVF